MIVDSIEKQILNTNKLVIIFPIFLVGQIYFREMVTDLEELVRLEHNMEFYDSSCSVSVPICHLFMWHSTRHSVSSTKPSYCDSVW